jgi:hypothetical protein
MNKRADDASSRSDDAATISISEIRLTPALKAKMSKSRLQDSWRICSIKPGRLA